MPRQSIEVKVSASQMKASVALNPDPAGMPPEVYEVVDELRANGVVFGISREAIESLLARRRWGEWTQVACGVEPLPGENGWVEYFFDPELDPRPRQLDNDRVDYREIGLIQVVQKDVVLARLCPPTLGVPGTNVLGAEIPAQPGAPAVIRSGRNTTFADETMTELRATVTGSVSRAPGGAVHVEHTLIVPGDVDYSSGNIDFPGDVIIRGDVKGGFRVCAGGKVEVRGVVEDAIIEAKGDVLVKGGFEGTGRGLIRAGGAVHLKFVENQAVEAQGPIRLGENALNARLNSGDFIYLDTGAGAVLGGCLKARLGLRARVLGNPGFIPTVVEIQQEEESDPEIERLRGTLEHLGTETTNLERSLSLLGALDHSQVRGAPQRERERLALTRRLAALNARREREAQTLQELITKKETDLTGKVVAQRRIYPGVRVIIAGIRLVVKEACGRTVMRRRGLDIVATTWNAGGPVPSVPVAEASA
ncbi:MAG: DUF342 domain-containing protein [Candidatus Zixiibacteriota bacterium]|nr:MAG: DUF342 domain-containing protein [candidate division Zixibacteria bacterium]